jgi:DNA-binding transcriptional regulator/RsmH inhibitor MraZ
MKIRSIASALLLVLVALVLSSCTQQNTEVKVGSSPSTSADTDVKTNSPPTNLATSELFLFTRNGKYGYIDRTGKIVIPAKFEYAGYFSEGLAIVAIGGKYGYIDRTGKIVIPAKLESARYFSEGLAIVEIGEKYGYIDRTGKIVIPAKFESANDFSEGLAGVLVGNRYGYIDKTGKIVIPAEFERASYFSEGLAIVEIGEKYGYIDRTGKIVIPAKFESANDFSEGLAGVTINSCYSTNPCYIFIDRNGNIVADRVKKDKDNTDKVISQFDERAKQVSGMVWVLDEQNRIGYADKQGRLVIPPKYDWLPIFPDDRHDFHDGLARVCLNNKCGYIDRTGKVVIPLKFDDAAAKFSDGLAWVVINKRLGYIDRTGTVKIPARFGHSGIRHKMHDPTQFITGTGGGGLTLGYDFQHGLAAVQIPIPASCKSDGSCNRYRYGYINTTGKIVFEF